MKSISIAPAISPSSPILSPASGFVAGLDIDRTNFPVIKHEFVQVIVPKDATKTQYYFPDNPNLRNVRHCGIEQYVVDVLPVTPDGTVVSTNADAQVAFITLVGYNGQEFIKNWPLTAFLYFIGLPNSNFFTKQLTRQRVNWPKSYITFRGTFPVATTFAFAFSIYYRENRAKEKAEAKADFDNKY